MIHIVDYRSTEKRHRHITSQ